MANNARTLIQYGLIGIIGGMLITAAIYSGGRSYAEATPVILAGGLGGAIAGLLGFPFLLKPRNERPNNSPATQAEKPRPSRIALWVKFWGGTLYFVGVSVLIDAISGLGMLRSLLFTALSALLAIVLGLTWLNHWAFREGEQPRQFRLATLLLVTGAISVYLGIFRLLLHGMNLREGLEIRAFVMLAVTGLIFSVVSIFPLLYLAESLVWLAAWVVRRPGIRRIFVRQRPPRV